MSETQVETPPKSPETKVLPSGEHKSAQSDNRIARLAKHRLAHEPKQPETESAKKVVDPSNGDKTSSEATSKEEQPKIEAKAGEETQPPKTPESEEKPSANKHKPDTLEFYREEAKKFQGKFDSHKAETDKVLAEREAKTKELESRIAELSKKAELVDKFETDPLSVIQAYLPDIQEKMALQSGNPINYVEQKVSQAKTLLEEKFKKEHGSDWKFSRYEASEPGTPSFRYQLALEQVRDSAKAEFQSYVVKQREAMQSAQQRVVEDKAKLKTEFGLTDEDFAVVDEFAQKNNATYYNVAKMALIDKIIEYRIKAAGVLAPHKPQADITQSSSSPAKIKTETKLSEGAKKMTSRLGANAFRH